MVAVLGRVVIENTLKDIAKREKKKEIELNLEYTTESKLL